MTEAIVDHLGRTVNTGVSAARRTGGRVNMGVPQSWQRGAESIFGKETAEGPKGQQRMFLLRLRRLIWLRRSCVGQLDDAILKVLDKAIYSTYCDCLEADVADEARQLLKQAE